MKIKSHKLKSHENRKGYGYAKQYREKLWKCLTGENCVDVSNSENIKRSQKITLGDKVHPNKSFVRSSDRIVENDTHIKEEICEESFEELTRKKQEIEHQLFLNHVSNFCRKQIQKKEYEIRMMATSREPLKGESISDSNEWALVDGKDSRPPVSISHCIETDRELKPFVLLSSNDIAGYTNKFEKENLEFSAKFVQDVNIFNSMAIKHSEACKPQRRCVNDYSWDCQVKDSKKEKPELSLSEILAGHTNLFNGRDIKYSEPGETRKPQRRWVLYPVSDSSFIPMYRQSTFLFGRDKSFADIPINHPTCSKQHAKLQFFLVPYAREDGTKGHIVKPYIMDLKSSNGTFVNNTRIGSCCYVELKEKDEIKFGYSSDGHIILCKDKN